MPLENTEIIPLTEETFNFPCSAQRGAAFLKGSSSVRMRAAGPEMLRGQVSSGIVDQMTENLALYLEAVRGLDFWAACGYDGVWKTACDVCASRALARSTWTV
jgi:hypothetical protein